VSPVPEQQEARPLCFQEKEQEKQKEENKMKSIDKEILAGYNAGIERGRLRTGIGLLEFARSKELLLSYLPKPPAVIYDLGGGYGEYAW
jgi:hypothetical protein